MSDEVRVITEEAYYANRDEWLRKIGLTWDELQAMVQPCGCHLKTPEGYMHGHLAELVWRTFKHGWEK